MITNLKALVVVFGIALIVFAVARPVCLRFMAEADFVHRRNTWFALTVVAFVSPNFWFFAAIAMPLLAWSAHKDPNPLALYILVSCVVPPNIEFDIPVVGINALFPMSYLRVLSFAVLLPIAWRLLGAKAMKNHGRFSAVEWFILAYAVLHLALWAPYESATHIMRRGFLYFIDIVILYFVAIRACSSRKALVEVLAMFCLLCTVLASIAVFESQRGWLLYQGISIAWGDPIAFAYAMRDGSLRAQVSAGHSIPLGYLLAIGFGIWVYLSAHVKSRQWTVMVGLVLWAGLISAHARAPWITAVVVAFAYLALVPNGAARVVRAAVASAILAIVVAVSPIGGRIIDNLPFIGSVGQENVEYRQLLATQSWEMVQRNPFFGDVSVLNQLESLRQGEGIIDLVNTYAHIAMFYGLVGLTFYLAPFVIGLWKSYKLSRQTARSDPAVSTLGALLVACMVGFLLAMAMGGFGPVVQNLAAVLIGLSATYARLGLREAATTPVTQPRTPPRAPPPGTVKRV